MAASIASAAAQIDQLEVEHKSGKQEIGGIVERLRAMQARFTDELALLEEHAEWERFTIAFFGETNAGKSTMIESLRILFDEQSRRQLLEQNAADLERYQRELERHVDIVRRGFAEAHAAYAGDIAAVRADFELAFQQESTARASAESALARARRNVWIAAIAGCVAGAALIGLMPALLH